MLKFILITNVPELAAIAEKSGVDRIFVDLESMGKKERQGHLDTFISRHTMEDISAVRKRLTSSQLLVRLNPLHEHSKNEIDEAIHRGAELLMLPMFHQVSELEEFCEQVGGRVPVVPLVETYSAASSIGEIVKVKGLSEIYIGLNDLHLDMQYKFMFEPLADGFIDEMVSIIKNANMPFGLGGIAQLDKGAVPGAMVLAEHYRLGSSWVILSRSFCKEYVDNGSDDVLNSFKSDITDFQMAGRKLSARSESEIQSDRELFRKAVVEYLRSSES